MIYPSKVWISLECPGKISSIKIETIEQTWDTIMRGMNETKAIEEENRKMREEGRLRLEELQKKYENGQRK